MLTGQLVSTEAKISLPEKLLRIDISCINNTLNHIHNNIISNTIPIIQHARTLHYSLHQQSLRAGAML